MKALLCLLLLLIPINAQSHTTGVIKEESQPLVALKPTACYLDAEPRRPPVPLHCANGYEHDKVDDLCYPECKEAYVGLGPICSTKCPQGYAETGALCTSMKLKGGCCGTGSCEICPGGHIDLGCFCSKTAVKDSYGRGAGIPTSCSLGQERTGKECYPACPTGYMVIGSTCWGGPDLENFPIYCTGIGIFYGQDKETCDYVTRELGAAGLSSGCVSAVLAFITSAQNFQTAATKCGSNLNSAIAAINNVLNHTNAQTCNPISPHSYVDVPKCGRSGAI